ncbi:MAG: AAA family ATPase [Magnetococcales bacterium]|nr:AAA family ATPase [Magnetococcales bacterium]
MYFVRLHLLAYGCFTDHLLEIPRASGLSIIHGANEAGKSTTLAAMTDFLFGFGTTTPYDFRHDNPYLRIGATLGNERGERLTAVRRKGNRETLLDAAGKTPLDPQALHPFLEGVDRHRFEMFYGLDHGRLQRGGEAILHGEGEVGTLLFEAGSGIAGVRGLMDRMREERERLYKPRGKNQVINTLNHRLVETQGRIRQQALSRDQWSNHVVARDRLLRQSAALREILGEKKRQERHLRRIVTLGPMFARLTHYRSSREQLETVPRLSAGLMRERASLMTRKERTDEALTSHLRERNALEERLAAILVEEKLVEHAARIKILAMEARSLRERLRELSELQVKLADLNARQTDLWLRVGAAADEPSERLLPDATCRALLDRLREDRQRTLAKTAELERAIRIVQAEAREHREALPPLGRTEDLALFRERLPWLRRLLQREREAVEAFVKGRSALAQADLKLSLLPLWRGDMAALEACHPPTTATMDRFIQEWQRDEEDERRSAEGLRQARENLRQLEAGRSRDDRTLGERPPTEAMVREVRSRRDEVWKNIYLHGLPGLDGKPDCREGASSGGDGDPRRAWGESLTAWMAQADLLVDGRLRAAGQLAQWRRLEQDIEANMQQERMLSERLAGIGERRRAMKNSWNELWQSLGVACPGTPMEMKGWPELRGEILRLAAEGRSWNEKGMAVRQELSAAIIDASEMVVALGGPGMEAGEEMGVTIERWEIFLNQCSALVERRAAVERRLAEIERSLETHREELEENERLRRENEERWRALMGPFGHPLGLEVESSAAFLGSFDTLHANFRQREEWLARIRDIEGQRDRFMVGVRELSLLLGEGEPAANERHVLERVEQLEERLDRTMIAVHRREELRKGIEERRNLERECHATRTTIARRFEEIGERYGTRDPEEMAAIEEQVRSKEEVDRKIGECEGEMLASAEGATLEEVTLEVLGQDVDVARAELDRIQVEIDRLTGELRTLDQDYGGEVRELQAMTGSDAVACLRQEMEGLGHDLVRHAEHHVRLGLAEGLLQRVIERFQEQNQDPVLHGAARYFRELTAGSFVDLRLDHDGQRHFFHGVRPGGERVRVEGMSAGTRDQLFLALRLGAMESLNEGHQPMPLILDDLLVHFDDHRAAAALKILSGLERQVIYFTHHPHLLELAHRHLASGLFGSSQLNGTT